MPIFARYDADGVYLPIQTDELSVRVSDLPPRFRSKPKDQQAAEMQSMLQAALDKRTLLSDLPDDDPDKAVDPARPNLFWQEIDGAMFLVGRPIRIEIEWNGERFYPTITAL